MNLDILSSQWYIPTEDYWRYWTAWRINRLGYNPYDSSNLQFFGDDFPGIEFQPVFLPIILTPPWTLSLLAPFVILDYPTSRLLWLLSSMVVLLICTNTIWHFYHGPKQNRWVGWLVTFTFFPSTLLLRQGQITIFVLLGIVGFLYFIERHQNDWLAGASLALTTIKPQLLFLFWIALFFWVVQGRRWKILFGCGLALLGASFPVFLDNPAVFQQFVNEYTRQSAALWMTPTLGYYLRLLFGPERFWLNFLPLLFGIFWLLLYWRQKKKQWQWSDEIQPILWASFLTTAYSFTYDQVVLLLPILVTAVGVVDRNPNRSSIPWLAGLVGINILTFVLHRSYTDEFFIWLVPVLFLWHWLASRYRSQARVVLE